MKKLILKPCNASGKYLRINAVFAEWDTGRRAFAATITFNLTRDRPDNKPLGTIIYAFNHETLCKMLQEYALLYPPRNEIIVLLPEQGSKDRLCSYRAN